MEKPQEEEPKKTNIESEVQSMIMVPIHQDTSLVPPMTTPVIDLAVSQPVFATVQAPLPTSTSITSAVTTTTTLPPPPPQPQQSTADQTLLHCICELQQHMVNLLQYNLALEEMLDKHGSRLYNLKNLNIPHQLSKAVDEIVTDEILQQRMFKDISYEAHEDHKNFFDALEKSLESDYSNQLLSDLEAACQKKRKRRDLPRTPSRSPPPQPPPPPPPAGVSGASGALGYSQLPLPPPPPSTGTSGLAKQQGKSSPIDFMMNDDSIPNEQVQLSDDEDTENDHLSNADTRKDWWKPLPEEERPATPEPAWTIPSSNVSDIENNWASALVSTYELPAENSLLAKIGDMTTFMNWYCRKVNKIVLTQAYFEGKAYEVVKAFYPDVVHLQFQMEECHKLLTDQIDWANPGGDQVKIDVSRPLPLGSPPGHVSIQTQFFFNKDLEYLRNGNKGSNPTLSISKMKAARYPDFGLELLVLEQMWIDDVCTYYISAKYGIYHWWFNRQKFYIDIHDSMLRQKEVRTHMRILSVVRIKAYSRYGYDYLSEIVLRRADFQDHTITKKDFKNLYPNDFKDLNLLLLQGHLNHLPGFDKRESINSVFARFNTIITSLKALNEGYSSKNYVRKFLRALHPKWRAKVTTIEESKDLTSLSFDELIGNLKVYEMIIKKDSEIVKEKVERKSLALKAKKESSAEECSTFGSKDEEYAMATFQRRRDEKNDKSDRKCFRCGDPNHLIGECLNPSKDKNQIAFVEGSWSDSGEEDDEKVKNKTCLVA
uniref:UBN2 domain-containing protein n=1 Tax=Tanacetum cinerariifolium TaxID=118510 RepID=A0A6L2JLD5_TANCI|nr:UBN2 domain-containing protein [Tanacetum cinerariifolium]